MAVSPHYELIAHDAIDSTNMEAMRLIQDGKINGDVVVTAKTQSSGKGRMGRSWVSTEGNLFASIIKGQWQSSVAEPNILPFVCALAVGDTLHKFIDNKGGDIKYKWPNDVLVDGKKICGILIELISGYVVIGIGINIAGCPESGTKLQTTFLNKYLEGIVSPDDVLAVLLQNVDKRLGAPQGEILHDWMARSYGINDNITVAQENKAISGIYRGIDENGRLILETNQGKRELVLFGDVLFPEPRT